MAELLLLNKISTDSVAVVDMEVPEKDATLQNSCLVAEYMSYMASAGYSQILH